MDYFNSLPLDISLDILTRLPTESVLECKLVCTTWRSLVTHNPSFSKLHLHRLVHPSTDDDSGKFGFVALTLDHNFYYIEYNENHDESTSPIQRIRRVNYLSSSPFSGSRYVGSCNGLICFSRCPSVYICNPIIQEYVILMLPELKRDSCYININGFGFVNSTNEYKVVATYVSIPYVEVHVYTLGSGNGWRNIGKFKFRFSINAWEVPGIFSIGALYWLDHELKTIIVFDLADEKFCEHLSPPPLPPFTNNWRHSKIGDLNGLLYFAAYLVAEKVISYDMWLLKIKNDNHEMKREREEHQSLVWSKEFRVGDGRLIAVTKSNEFLTFHSYYLNLYDTKTSTSKMLVQFKLWVLGVFTHRNTLVSLKELGEEDTKVMESAKMEETNCWAYSVK